MEKKIVAYFYIISRNLPEGPNKTTNNLRVTGLWVQI